MSLQNAFLGSLVADAVSMPVHWYYNRGALDRTMEISPLIADQKTLILTAYFGEVNSSQKIPRQISLETN